MSHPLEPGCWFSRTTGFCADAVPSVSASSTRDVKKTSLSTEVLTPAHVCCRIDISPSFVRVNDLFEPGVRVCSGRGRAANVSVRLACRLRPLEVCRKEARQPQSLIACN